MQDQNDGQAVVDHQAAELCAKLACQHRVDRCERLVPKQQARAADQRTGDADALPLAA